MYGKCFSIISPKGLWVAGNLEFLLPYCCFVLLGFLLGQFNVALNYCRTNTCYNANWHNTDRELIFFKAILTRDYPVIVDHFYIQ